MTAVVEPAPATGATTPERRQNQRAVARAAHAVVADSSRVVFAAFSAAAIAYWFRRAGGVWFVGDDWYPLAGRVLDVDGLLEQHAGHLIALPVVAYRILYWAFGVRSYTPYLLVTIALHVTIAWQLRSLMLRAGVGHWIATPLVAIWLFFGPGATNVMFAFQMTLAGSLALGLFQLRFADHDGTKRRRDAIGALAGVAAVACSGVGVAMVAATGAAVLMRRGLHAAAIQVLPAAAVYGMWFASPWSDSETTYPRSTQVWLRGCGSRSTARSWNSVGRRSPRRCSPRCSVAARG